LEPQVSQTITTHQVDWSTDGGVIFETESHQCIPTTERKCIYSETHTEANFILL